MNPCEKPPLDSQNILAIFERFFQVEQYFLIAICRFCVILGLMETIECCILDSLPSLRSGPVVPLWALSELGCLSALAALCPAAAADLRTET